MFKRYIHISAWFLTLFLVSGQVAAQSENPFRVNLESGYERTALSYHLLSADTTVLDADSLTTLRRASDIRSEPFAGVLVSFDQRSVRLANNLSYSRSGWHEHFTGDTRSKLASGLEWRNQVSYQLRQTQDVADSILSDYSLLTARSNLRLNIARQQAIFARLDWERLAYEKHVSIYAYDYSRLRWRAGWAWEADNFDYANLAFGTGTRSVPDSTEREYDEHFALGYGHHSLSTAQTASWEIGVNRKDFSSANPRDDYTLWYSDLRWDYRLRSAVTLSGLLRWEYWHFGAQDEVLFDYYELEPGTMVKLPLNELWTARISSRLRLMRAVNDQFSAGNYLQPALRCGLEFIAPSGLVAEMIGIVSYRNYKSEESGYSNYTNVGLNFLADYAMPWNLHITGTLDYEREFHATKEDDTDFFYFTLAMSYRIF